MKSLKEIKSQLSKERQEKIEKRAQELIKGENILRSLRQHRNITQTNLSEILGIDQSSISKLEGRNDFLLSTLNTYILALGGTLEIQARFPDQSEPIDLSAVLSKISN